ncbi:MAG: hypothetical protein AAF717_00220 [Bacteroidota bacterium]
MQLKKQEKPELLALITASEYRDSLVVKHYGNLTMATAMNSTGMSLGRLAKTEGEEKVVKGVAKMFLACSLYFGENFSQDMAEVVVQKILGEYQLRSMLKLEDLVVICKEIVSTEQFGRFSAHKLLTHIKKYQKRRMSAAINASQIQNLEQKHQNNLEERIHNSVKLPERLERQVDRTRGDVRKYYK